MTTLLDRFKKVPLPGGQEAELGASLVIPDGGQPSLDMKPILGTEPTTDKSTPAVIESAADPQRQETKGTPAPFKMTLSQRIQMDDNGFTMYKGRVPVTKDTERTLAEHDAFLDGDPVIDALYDVEKGPNSVQSDPMVDEIGWKLREGPKVGKRVAEAMDAIRFGNVKKRAAEWVAKGKTRPEAYLIASREHAIAMKEGEKWGIPLHELDNLSNKMTRSARASVLGVPSDAKAYIALKTGGAYKEAQAEFEKERGATPVSWEEFKEKTDFGDIPEDTVHAKYIEEQGRWEHFRPAHAMAVDIAATAGDPELELRRRKEEFLTTLDSEQQGMVIAMLGQYAPQDENPWTTAWAGFVKGGRGMLDWPEDVVLRAAGTADLAKSAASFTQAMDVLHGASYPTPEDRHWATEGAIGVAEMAAPMLITGSLGKAASITMWAMQGYTEAYDTAIRFNVDHDTARVLSVPAAILYSYTERLTFERAVGAGRATKGLLNKARDAGLKRALKTAPMYLKGRVVDWGIQTIQEGLQRFEIEFFAGMGTYLSKNAEGWNAKEWADAVSAAGEEMKQAGKSMLFLTIAGSVGGPGSFTSTRAQSQAEVAARIRLREFYKLAPEYASQVAAIEDASEEKFARAIGVEVSDLSGGFEHEWFRDLALEEARSANKAWKAAPATEAPAESIPESAEPQETTTEAIAPETGPATPPVEESATEAPVEAPVEPVAAPEAQQASATPPAAAEAAAPPVEAPEAPVTGKERIEAKRKKKAPPVEEAPVVEKQPWEMTREEQVSEGFIYSGKVTDRALKGQVAEWQKKVDALPDSEGAAEGLARATRKQNLANEHKQAVRDAVSEGKPVPAEVLSDYAGESWADSALAKTGDTGKSLFTAAQIDAFDAAGIDVSGVTADYKEEALQQLSVTRPNADTSPDYDTGVMQSYAEEARRRNAPMAGPEAAAYQKAPHELTLAEYRKQTKGSQATPAQIAQAHAAFVSAAKTGDTTGEAAPAVEEQAPAAKPKAKKAKKPVGMTEDEFRAKAMAIPNISAAQADAVVELIKAFAETVGGGTDVFFAKAFADLVQNEVTDIPEAQQAAEEGSPPRGAVSFLASGQAIIRAFETADVSTLLHESGHVFLQWLPADLKAIVDKWAGGTGIVASEKFASAFERYLRKGEAPPGLTRIFKMFKEWLRNIYRRLTDRNAKHLNYVTDENGKRHKVVMSPEILGVFDAMLGGRPVEDATYDREAKSLDTVARKEAKAIEADVRAVYTELRGLSPEDEIENTFVMPEYQGAEGNYVRGEFSRSFAPGAVSGELEDIKGVSRNVEGGTGEDVMSDLGDEEYLRRIALQNLKPSAVVEKMMDEMESLAMSPMTDSIFPGLKEKIARWRELTTWGGEILLAERTNPQEAETESMEQPDDGIPFQPGLFEGDPNVPADPLTGRQKSFGIGTGDISEQAIGEVEIKDELHRAAVAEVLRPGAVIKNAKDLYTAILHQHKGETPGLFNDSKNPMRELQEAYLRAVKGKSLFGGESIPPSGMLFQSGAWHGSPHKFDQFSTDAMGTGEGAQSFGWGLYFTSEEEIARYYADNLSSRHGATDNSIITLDGAEPSLDRDARGDIVALWPQSDKTLASLRRMIHLRMAEQKRDASRPNNLQPWIAESNAERFRATLKALEGFDSIDVKPSRNLYRVTLWKDKQENVLEWEKPIPPDMLAAIEKQGMAEGIIAGDRVASSQHAEIIAKYGSFKKLLSAVKAGSAEAITDRESLNKLRPAEGIYGAKDGQAMYHQIANIFMARFSGTEAQGRADREASLFLQRAGIDGIKYRAGTLSGVDSEAYNYVVFDGAAAQIEEHTLFQPGPKAEDAKLEDLPDPTSDFSAPTKAIIDGWFAALDLANYDADRITAEHQKDILRISGRKMYDQKAKTLDAAILIYIDNLGQPGKYAEHADDIPEKYRAAFELAQNLPDEAKALARKIIMENGTIGRKAYAAKVIKGLRENYIARIFDVRIGDDGRPVVPNAKFRTKPGGREKKRVLASVLDGLAMGLELKISGATNAQNTATKQINQALHDRAMILMGMKAGVITASRNSEQGNWERIDHPNFRWPVPAARVELDPNIVDPAKTYGRDVWMDEETGTLWRKAELFAPPELARKLNAVLANSKLTGRTPVIGVVYRWNTILKHTILTTSLYHYQAFMRSFMLGGQIPILGPGIEGARAVYGAIRYIVAGYKGDPYTIGRFLKTPLRAINPFGWTRGGIEAMAGFKAGQRAFAANSQDLRDLVEQGLTIGRIQDWDELAEQQKTIVGKIIDKIPVAKQIKDKLLELRDYQTQVLFQRIGPALKAQAAILEYKAELKRYSKELEAGTMTRQELAASVASLMNDDFGGLHTQRLSAGGAAMRTWYSPTAQAVKRLFLLAPDWTESNVRSMIKAFKGGHEGKLYRRFWTRIAIKGLTYTFLFNVLMSLGDDDDVLDRYKAAWKEGNLRWLDVDVTPVAKVFGSQEGKRKYFSLIGHFRDPIKFVAHPATSVKHKGSVITRLASEFMSGSDWRGRRFTTFAEWLGSEGPKSDPDKYKAKLVSHRFTDRSGPIGMEEAPSFLMSSFLSSMPIQVQNLVGFILGQTDGFDALTKSLGLMTSTSYPKWKKKGSSSKAPKVNRFPKLR